MDPKRIKEIKDLVEAYFFEAHEYAMEGKVIVCNTILHLCEIVEELLEELKGDIKDGQVDD